VTARSASGRDSTVLPLQSAPDRGPLLTPDQVATLIGAVSPAWVRRIVPFKLRLGQRTVRWYERDVRSWIETHRGAA